MSNKLPTSFRLSGACRELLRDLAFRLGVSQASVIEMSVRDRARREGIDSAPPPER